MWEISRLVALLSTHEFAHLLSVCTLFFATETPSAKIKRKVHYGEVLECHS